MGMNANVLIADSQLSDAALAELDLEPLGVDLTAEAVLLTPSEFRASVVRTEGQTIIIDGSDTLAVAIDGPGLTLPGRVLFAASVSTVDFSDLLIVDDGRVVRHLRQEEGTISIDEGEPLAAESEFLVSADASADSDEIENGETADEVEVDGDLLIQRLPVLAGMREDTDLFALTGTAFASSSGREFGESQSPTGDPAALAPAKRGFFTRLFGR